MNTEVATLGPQTRQMLGEVATLTEGQGKDWLGRVMLKDEFVAVAQDYLRTGREDCRAGLQRIEYSILMRFAAAMERTLFTWRGPELAQRLEAVQSNQRCYATYPEKDPQTRVLGRAARGVAPGIAPLVAIRVARLAIIHAVIQAAWLAASLVARIIAV